VRLAPSRLVLTCALFAAGLPACRQTLPDRPRAFVGAAACAKCHGGAEGNGIHEAWLGTAHARAWSDLAGARADSIAEGMGVTGRPPTAAACLECHSTGHAAPAGLKVALPPAEGVSCEACHNAGADYAKKLVMPDPREARRAGLRSDPREACASCHRAGVAHIRPFDYQARWPLIAHALPDKTP
jgi:hypothetical protein